MTLTVKTHTCYYYFLMQLLLFISRFDLLSMLVVLFIPIMLSLLFGLFILLMLFILSFIADQFAPKLLNVIRPTIRNLHL